MTHLHESFAITNWKKVTRTGKLEVYYFYFFLLLNLVPVLLCKFFPTVDGPAHLYNSAIIVELIQHCNSPVTNFFDFNNHITPNWSGHFLLASFLFFLPSFLAEKLVLLIYLIGLPLSMRYLFKAIHIQSNYLLYLIFPFTYSFIFYYGFYNFNIGLVLLFFGLGYWCKNRSNLNLYRAFLLMLVGIFICLSHLMVFAIFLMTLLILNIEHVYIRLKRNETDKLSILKYVSLMFVSILPGLVIAMNFILTNHSMRSAFTYLPVKDILTSLKYIMPIKGIKYDGYGFSSRLILYIFVTLIIGIVSVYLYHWISKKEFILKNKTWVFICFLMLALLFILPDSTTSIGFISSRLLILFFLFLIIALATQEVPLILKLMVFLAINLSNSLVLFHNYKSVPEGCNMATEINAASKLIAPYSTVFPINKSENNLYAHISNYLGADKPIIILENYEATLDYFPLKWKENKFPIGVWTSVNDCFKENIQIDYIFMINEVGNERSSKTDSSLHQLLDDGYTEIFRGDEGIIELFRNKRVSVTSNPQH
jgi:hypothetical protein